MEENYNYNYEAPEEPVIEAKPKRDLKKILIPVIAVIVVLAIAIPLLYGLVFNTYKTPLKLAEAELNAKTYNASVKAGQKLTNGLLNKEAKTISNIILSSENYDKDDLKDYFEEKIESYKDQYGSNYKFYYEIEDKEKLDKDELKDIKDSIKETGKSLQNEMEETDDYDSDDWEEAAEDMGVSKSDVKKYAKTMKSVAKKLKSVKVTAGYELDVKLMVKGSELDEPEELEDRTITVCKVNGKWVNVSSLLSF